MALTEQDLKNLPEMGIDTENPGKYQGLLEDLQGNILKGHGRDASVHLFLGWEAEQTAEMKKWLSRFSKTHLSSAKQQSEEALRYRTEGISGEPFVNIFLTAQGYRLLGIPAHKMPSDVPFRNSMQSPDIIGELNDPPVSEWEKAYQNNICALILIADDDENKLSEIVNKITEELQNVGKIIHQENGFIPRNKAGQVIEHFGFVDGISQPLFLKRDIMKALNNDQDFSKWDPRASLDIVLVKDKNGQTEDSYGSYLVYRKLEQNVKAFREDEQQLAQTLNINNELAGAFVMGRFTDGTPVTQSDVPTGLKYPSNNFNYNEDRPPTKCPFHAHVRKSNPRGDTGKVESSPGFREALDLEKSHRIARRAISYGEKDLNKTPETGSGLLFICFQANIENQFNFIQKGWSNPNHFVEVGVGIDPVIGQRGGQVTIPQKWPIKWGENETKEFNFESWVTMKGGEYFFAPSISFLTSLN